jgi:hypothetical protein
MRGNSNRQQSRANGYRASQRPNLWTSAHRQPPLPMLCEEAADVSFLDDLLLIAQTWMVAPVSAIALDGSFRYCDLIGHGIVNGMRARIDFVPIFTDEDLANRYIRLVSTFGMPLRVYRASTLNRSSRSTRHSSTLVSRGSPSTREKPRSMFTPSRVCSEEPNKLKSASKARFMGFRKGKETYLSQPDEPGNLRNRALKKLN